MNMFISGCFSEFSQSDVDTLFNSVYSLEKELGFLTFESRIIQKLMKTRVVFWNQLKCVLFIAAGLQQFLVFYKKNKDSKVELNYSHHGTELILFCHHGTVVSRQSFIFPFPPQAEQYKQSYKHQDHSLLDQEDSCTMNSINMIHCTMLTPNLRFNLNVDHGRILTLCPIMDIL